jgi:SAM-dependent methyltransferase
MSGEPRELHRADRERTASTGTDSSSARCTACGSAARLAFETPDLNRRISPTLFRYYQCPACGLIFLSPIPSDLSAYYPGDYHSFPRTKDAVAQAAEPERYKLDVITRFASPTPARGARLVEIGPSWGAFLHLAKNAGFEAEAIEMDPICCRYIEETIGAKVVRSDDPASALSRLPPYDVIALWHVIEHVADPWSLLQSAAARLNPGGILVIATPNPEAFQFRITRRRWPHVDAPRHVALIPLALLGERVRSMGLERIWATTRDPGSLGWNTFGWEWFFANLTRMRVINFGLRLLGRLTAALLSPVEGREGAGSAYTVVFRKTA